MLFVILKKADVMAMVVDESRDTTDETLFVDGLCLAQLHFAV